MATTGTPAMGVYVSSAAGSIEHGSTAVFRMTSSRAMHIHAPYTVSTYVVTQGSPVGTQSTWPLGVQSTFALNTAAPSGVQSTFAVAGSAKTSTHIAGQTGPVSTFAINTAAPSGTQSTWALNKTSTHIAGQSITLSTVAVPPTTGGLSAAAVVSLTTSAFQVNNAPTQMYGVWFTNSAGTLRWLKFYDAGAVTVGTTPPNFYIGLPPNSTTGWMPPGAHGIQFNTSCFIAATTGQATSDATAPTTNDVTVSVFYKS